MKRVQFSGVSVIPGRTTEPDELERDVRVGPERCGLVPHDSTTNADTAETRTKILTYPARTLLSKLTVDKIRGDSRVMRQ